MTIENLLDVASEIHTMITPHHHHIPVIIKRHNTHIEAMVHYTSYFSDPSDFPSPVTDRVTIAVEQICPTDTVFQLLEHYKNVSAKIDEYVQKNDSIFKDTGKDFAISFQSIFPKSYDYSLYRFGHIFELENLRAFFKIVESQKLNLNYSKIRPDVDADEQTYYFKIEEDFDAVLKITLIDSEFVDINSPSNIIKNLELVYIHPTRDEVIRSASDDQLDDFNQDLGIAANFDVYKPLLFRISHKLDQTFAADDPFFEDSEDESHQS